MNPTYDMINIWLMGIMLGISATNSFLVSWFELHVITLILLIPMLVFSAYRYGLSVGWSICTRESKN